MNQSLRLNKVLSQLGVGSRRAVDELIASGLVAVNGKPAVLGQRVSEKDRIQVKGNDIDRQPLEHIVIAFHKPKGITTTKQDRFAKVTVMDYLPTKLQHLFPVGRLDRDSRGLLLLTNDGDLALKLTHPRYQHEKEYEVTVVPFHPISLPQFNQHMHRLSHEIISPELQTKPIKVVAAEWNKQEKHGKITLILQEGKKRQIRNIFRRLGYLVTDLFRTRIGQLRIDNLPEGEYCKVDLKKL